MQSLVHGLPASSRTWAAEHGGWTVTDHLIATNSELTHQVYRAVVASIPQRHPRRVEPYRAPRPGAEPKRKRVSPLEFMRTLEGVTDA